MQYRDNIRDLDIQREISRMYAENKEKLRIFIRASVDNSSAVEDIMQDVFVEALKKYDILREHPNQKGWLYLTARHKIQEYDRAKRKHTTVDLEEEMVAIGDREQGYLMTELQEMISSTLSVEELLRFRRYYLWGYTAEELAAKEGITVNNMRVRLNRLKNKLKQCL